MRARARCGAASFDSSVTDAERAHASARLGLLFGIGAYAIWGFFPLYFPELFPTSVRATGQGFCFNFGRLVAAIGALQLGNLMSMFNGPNVTAVQSAANAYSVLSCIYLVGMVLVWFAPETKGRSLQ